MNHHDQQRQQEEAQQFAFHALQDLKPFLSAETFKQAAKEIGMGE